jgi:hypothetical protein
MSKPRFSTDGLSSLAQKPVAIDPADANYCGEWIDSIGSLGLSVVVVQMDRCSQSFASSEFIASLGEEMRKAKLGHLDSSQWHPHIRHFFYAKKGCLGEALNFLKSGLETSGLGDISTIGYFDATEKIWRTFQPGIGT